jgi:D-sedoheptulose 7-phosphate isomerase
VSHAEACRRVRARLLANAEVMQELAGHHLDPIISAADMITAAFRKGRKVMLCGNGGSAAEAQHIAAEFTNRLRPDFPRPGLAALALTVDTTFITAHANDHGFEYVFQRQIEALGHGGDVLIALSTSGNSANVVRAVECCRDRDVASIGLLGGDGGQVRSLVDLPIVVPSDNIQHIQEAHLVIGHLLAELAELALFA